MAPSKKSKKKQSVVKATTSSKVKTKKKESPAKTSNAAGGNKKVVTIEACKQWGAFKTRANKILKAVGDKAIVEINKEKPGKGNFVVSIEGVDEPIVSLIGMKRPFPPLKALDMDEINDEVLSALS